MAPVVAAVAAVVVCVPAWDPHGKEEGERKGAPAIQAPAPPGAPFWAVVKGFPGGQAAWPRVRTRRAKVLVMSGSAATAAHWSCHRSM